MDLEESSLESLESPDTVVVKPDVVEQPADKIAEAAPVDATKQDLKFTGYTPPEKKGFRAFLANHKAKVAAAAGAFIVLGSVGGLLLASSGGDDSKQAPVANNQSTEANNQESNEQSQTDEPAVEHISDLQFSFDKTGQTYSLETLDGEVWLQRYESSWQNFAESGGWLFFTADRSGGDADNPIVGIEAFNYKTQKYSSIAEILRPGDNSVIAAMYIENGYLYVNFSGFKTAGATHRCKLDAKKACVELELFYDGPGQLHVHDNTTVYVVDGVGDAGASASTISVYNTESKKLTKVVDVSNTWGVGTYFAQVARDGLVWITEVKGDVDAAQQDPEYDGYSISRVYAVKPDGGIAFVIPGNAVPIANAVPIELAEVDANQILYANNNLEVIFNTDKKQFEAPTERFIADKASKKKTLLDDEVRLNVPKEYLMRIVE